MSSSSPTTPSKATYSITNLISLNASGVLLLGETYYFADGFDVAFMVRHYLEKMTHELVPLTMLTDSESLFKVILK